MSSSSSSNSNSHGSCSTGSTGSSQGGSYEVTSSGTNSQASFYFIKLTPIIHTQNTLPTDLNFYERSM